MINSDLCLIFPAIHRQWWLHLWVNYSRTRRKATDNQSINQLINHLINQSITEARLLILQYFDYILQLLEFQTLSCWSLSCTQKNMSLICSSDLSQYYSLGPDWQTSLPFIMGSVELIDRLNIHRQYIMKKHTFLSSNRKLLFVEWIVQE